jgi:putative endonuclease
MAEHNELGSAGEEMAQAYLCSIGYEILHTNWTTGKLELDIVAKKDDLLVIVEVKTRSTETFEHPKEAITLRKIKNIVNAAHEYIFLNDWMGETRFDVISVIPDGQKYKIEHIEDAFIPPVN